MWACLDRVIWRNLQGQLGSGHVQQAVLSRLGLELGQSVLWQHLHSYAADRATVKVVAQLLHCAALSCVWTPSSGDSRANRLAPDEACSCASDQGFNTSQAGHATCTATLQLTLSNSNSLWAMTEDLQAQRQGWHCGTCLCSSQSS